VDWAAVQQKIQTQAWAKQAFEKQQASFDRVAALYETPPLGVTGWLHEYFCEKGHQLTFDPTSPTRHHCARCGQNYTGSPYDDCWRSAVHSQIAGACETAGILYRLTGEPRYFDYVRKMLLWYAENFTQFQPHGSHAGKGIIREQSLDEATQLSRLAVAYWDICPDLTPADREAIATQYFLPDAQFIHKQTGTIHNIHCWHNAAVGLVGFALGDQELIAAAIDGPFGLIQQIKNGVSEDGFWYEGSISYHYYTISSLEPLYIAARAQQHPLPDTEKFLMMYTAPLRLAFSNGELPANNDCWPGQNLPSRTPYYEIAAHLFQDASVLQALANFYQTQPRASEQALLYGPSELPPAAPEALESTLFPHSGLAVLRNDTVNVLLKYGPYGGGHDHLDRLNLMLFAQDHILIPDLGTSGYGIALNQWFRSPVAHNMLVVDGKTQARQGGSLLHYDEHRIAALAGPVYPGVEIQRQTELLPAGLIDAVSAYSDGPHVYDLIYHIRGELQPTGLETQPCTTLPDQGGYQFLNQPVLASGESGITLRWHLRDTEGVLSMHITSPHPFQIITGTCPDNPADQEMSFVILRTEQSTAQWKNTLLLETTVE
jgi:hypothetical protein